ncbi:MAG: DUF2066 domain-containing protein [Methylococcaceae bacterium]|jgi:hypothetical protein
MRVNLSLMIICGLCFCQSVFSVEVNGLYETDVIANSLSPVDREDAVKRAFAVVLKRLVASGQVLQNPVLKSALMQPAPYVKQFQYALQEESLAETDAEARNLRVLFDEQAVLNLMKASQSRIWPDSRPETLVWLVVEDNGQRGFFRAETMPEVNAFIHQAAKQLGLPLLFPLLDLEEQQMVSINDVLSAYPQNLLTISQRYDVVSMLAGRLAKSKTCWKTDWAFYFNNAVVQWSSPCSSLEDAVLLGLQGVYQQLSQYYAVLPNSFEADSLTLKIAGVKGDEEQSRLTHYLKTMQHVKSVAWLGHDAGFDLYKVILEGKRQDFEELLGIGRVLNPKAVYPNGGTSELSYDLLPNQLNARLN